MSRPRAIDYLSVDDLLEIAATVVPGVRVRDAGLLASAVARPTTVVFGQDAYPEFPDKAAALLHALVRNHALIDGNKRLAWAATRAFCLLNDRDLACDDIDEAERFVVAAAAGTQDVAAIRRWLSEHVVEPV